MDGYISPEVLELMNEDVFFAINAELDDFPLIENDTTYDSIIEDLPSDGESSDLFPDVIRAMEPESAQLLRSSVATNQVGLDHIESSYTGTSRSNDQVLSVASSDLFSPISFSPQNFMLDQDIGEDGLFLWNTPPTCQKQPPKPVQSVAAELPTATNDRPVYACATLRNGQQIRVRIKCGGKVVQKCPPQVFPIDNEKESMSKKDLSKHIVRQWWKGCEPFSPKHNKMLVTPRSLATISSLAKSPTFSPLDSSSWLTSSSDQIGQHRKERKVMPSLTTDKLGSKLQNLFSSCGIDDFPDTFLVRALLTDEDLPIV